MKLTPGTKRTQAEGPGCIAESEETASRVIRCAGCGQSLYRMHRVRSVEYTRRKSKSSSGGWKSRRSALDS